MSDGREDQTAEPADAPSRSPCNSNGGERYARRGEGVNRNKTARRLSWAQLFRAPTQYFGGEDRTVASEGDLVRIEVGPFPRRPSRERAHGLAFGVDLQDAARDRVGHVEEMVGGDRQAEGMPEPPLPQKAAARVEDLDPGILPVADVDEVAVDRDRVRCVELSGAGAFHAPAEERVAE